MNRNEYLVDYIKMENDYWAIDIGKSLFVFHSLAGEPFIIDKSELNGNYQDLEFEGIDNSADRKRKIIDVSKNIKKIIMVRQELTYLSPR